MATGRIWTRRLWIVVGILAALALALAAYGLHTLSRSRDYQLFGKLVSHVKTAENVVALTFDDGPTADYTPQVLATLKEKNVKATFFLIGREIASAPDVAKAIVAAGHQVGNHTWDHAQMTLATEGKARAEIEPTDAQIRTAGYTGEIMFRPPNGKKLIGLPLYLAQHDRVTVMWDVEPDSYPAIASDPARIAAYVVDHVKPGSIVILHAMYKSRETTRQALPAIIDGLRAKGYRFLTVEELMKLGTG
jgi:peptidoglycan/xylan/chitin deacetylase (PgdA/CDA1 family)